MKLSDFNNPNRIEVTETYPFSHTNVLSEMEDIHITEQLLLDIIAFTNLSSEKFFAFFKSFK